MKISDSYHTPLYPSERIRFDCKYYLIFWLCKSRGQRLVDNYRGLLLSNKPEIM